MSSKFLAIELEVLNKLVNNYKMIKKDITT